MEATASQKLVSNASLFGSVLDDLISYQAGAPQAAEQCGGCGREYPTLGDVFSHDCDHAALPRTLVDGAMGAYTVNAPGQGPRPVAVEAPRPVQVGGAAHQRSPRVDEPIDPAKVEAWLVGLGRKVEDGDISPRVERAAREWIIRQDECRGEFMVGMQERAEKGWRLSVGQVRGIMNLWRAAVLRNATPVAPAAQPQQAPQAPAADVPAGRYAIETADGHVAFYKVDRPESGKWVGYTFVKQLIGAPGAFDEQRQSKAASQSILARIAAAGPAEAALLFSRKFTVCSRCLSPLSLVQSRATGFGSTCAGKIGVPYLSRAEALRVLDEEGISLEGLEDL